MIVNGVPTRTIRGFEDQCRVEVIDQTLLPFKFETADAYTAGDVAALIRNMLVRGAPLIGVTAAYGVAIAMTEDPSDMNLKVAELLLKSSRPTAVNLAWAVDVMVNQLAPLIPSERAEVAWAKANLMAEQDASSCLSIGLYGLEWMSQNFLRSSWNFMTHCNAGWLATVDYGTALAPIYAAHDAGIDVHVYVSETRPRNQGLLTAWELEQHGVPHTVIVDNAAGWVLANRPIDAVIVGADRVTANGDVINKVGTYLKSLAAKVSNVPFLVAAPVSTVDLSTMNGTFVNIEERRPSEVSEIHGKNYSVAILPKNTEVLNPSFDVTPYELVSALITDKGVINPSKLRDVLA